MDIDIEQSFIATLRMFDHKVNLLEMLYEKPAMATVSLFSGGVYTGRPQSLDHSSLLGIRPHDQGNAVKALKLHFRHTCDGYILSVKNTGEYYDKLVSESWMEVLGTVNSNEDDPTAFTLVDPQNKPITMDNIRATNSPVSLRTKNNRYVGGLAIGGSPYVYLANTRARSKITFALSILERKVPHISA